MSTVEHYILSIIIPHHNIPKLLERCYNSIPKRSDVQVIIVDDNSDENVVDFNNFPGNYTPNTICIFDKKGKGGGYARNIGLKYATGDFVTFVDADDYLTLIANEIIDDLYKLDANTDVLYLKGDSVDCDYYYSQRRADHLNFAIDKVLKGYKDAEKYLRFTFGEPWCKIVRHTLIDKNNIGFEETTIHNDTQYSYLVGYYANKIEVSPKAWAIITARAGSVSVSVSESKKLERIGVFARANRFYLDHNIEERYCLTFHWHQIANSLFENRQTYDEGCKIIESYGFSKCRIYKEIVKDSARRLLRGR